MQRNFGLACAVGANLLYAFAGTLAKLVFEKEVRLSHFMVFTCSIQCAISFIPFYRQIQLATANDTGPLLALASIGLIAKGSKYIGFALAEVGNVIAIGSLVALLVAPLGYAILGEALHFSYPIVLIGALMGIVVIIRPPFIFGSSSTTFTEMIGYVIVFFGFSGGYAFWIIAQRKWKMNAWINTFINRLFLFTAFGLYALIEHKKMILNWKIAAIICAQAICMFGGFFLLSLATERIESIYTSLIVLLQTPFAFIVQYIILGTKSSSYLVYVGILSTIFSVAGYIIVTSNRSASDSIQVNSEIEVPNSSGAEGPLNESKI